MLVVPIDAPGVTVVRNLPVFGYHDREDHAEITDVASAVAILASDAAGWITGETMIIDGGQVLGDALP